MAKERTRIQFGFEIDKALKRRLRNVAKSLQGVTQADLARAALHEKLTELEGRIAEGQKVTISI
jgi:hypothetical protein